MEAIEITTTAMARPELHDRVYRSLTENLLGVDWYRSSIYLNIDPLPVKSESERLGMEVLRDHCETLARGYFGRVIVNRPSSADHAKAVKWCWSRPTGPYVLNLEDDWLLYKKVEVDTLLGLLRPIQVYQVVLRWKTRRRAPHPYFVLGPSMTKGSIVRCLASELIDTMNPEMQLRTRTDFSIDLPNPRSQFSDECSRRYLVYRDGGPVARDIGTAWFKASRFYKIRNTGPLDKRPHIRNCLSWGLKDE